jgi:predicted ATPase/class 3 adenylate cyclase
MDFYTVLDEVIEILQRHGRVTYRALKRQFSLDDDYIEDLKAELVQARRLASDENGAVLIWTGEAAAATPEQASSVPQLATRGDQSISVEPLSATPPTHDAERRQLTVMFCDLVGSTALAGQLDPEDFREVVRTYQEMAAAMIHRFEGHIAQYLGDGLLVYFGFPKAHEDDAQRAVRAGIDVLETLDTLNTRLERQHAVRLAVRIGIHTGLVVVGEMGGGGRHEHLALGETPNIAARLEGVAAANSIVVSGTTQRLLGGEFDLELQGTRVLKGVAEPLPVYGVRGVRTIESRFEAAMMAGLSPLVGREEEISLVLRRWQQAKDGEGQVVLVGGEPGIGKSRLVQTVRERVGVDPHIRLRYQCSPYYTNSAFYPIITQLERAAQFARNDTAAQKLDKLETLLGQATVQVADVAPLFAALLAIPSDNRYPPLTLTPQQQKDQTLEALVAQLVGLARQQPVMLIFEDLHWSDPTSLEVLDRLLHRVSNLRVLVVMTYRSEFEPPWRGVAHVTTYTLNRLTRRQVTTLVAGMTNGKALPDIVVDQIAVKTDGVPLFVEELTKTILESGLLHETGEGYALTGPLPPLAIPTTLQDALMARLDRLAPVKEVAQIGAALGREFSYELIAAVSPFQDAALQDALDQLVHAALLFRRGTPPTATYLFKHALVQDTAYASLLKSRRQQLHSRIAQVLEARFPETVAAEPALLAHHHTEAGHMEAAISSWLLAGQQACQRSANTEAISHLTQGLTLLSMLPNTPERTHQELNLQTALGPALIATKGNAAPDVERTYARARELCQQLGDTPQLFPVLRGLIIYYNSRGQLQTAYQLGEQLLRLAQSQHDPALLLLAHYQLGIVLFMRGELVAAHTHHTQALAIYTPQEHRGLAVRYGIDLGVISQSFLSWELWYLGYPDQAMQHSQAARTLAQKVSHPHSLVHALVFAAFLHQHRREVLAVHEQATAATTLAIEQGFVSWGARGTVLHGWALATQGQGETTITEIRQGLAADLATGAKLWQPYSLGLLAEAYGEKGHYEEGLHALTEALAVIDTTELRFCAAELYCLKGVLLLQQALPDASQAKICFHQALNIARSQQAKSLELRAATSLARLWQSQGKRQDAYDLLAPVYGWFTEGFDTVDLKDAKGLLLELA